MPRSLSSGPRERPVPALGERVEVVGTLKPPGADDTWAAVRSGRNGGHHPGSTERATSGGRRSLRGTVGESVLWAVDE